MGEPPCLGLWGMRVGLKTRACTRPSGRRRGGGECKARLACFLPDPERKSGPAGVSPPRFTSAFQPEPLLPRGACAVAPAANRIGGSAGGEARAAPGRERGGLAHAQGGGMPQGGKGAQLSAPLRLRSDRTRRTWLSALLFFLLFLVAPAFAF